MVINYQLDTDICVAYMRGKYDLNKKVMEIGGFDRCVISEITLAELMYGAEASRNVAENMHVVEELAHNVKVASVFNSLPVYAKEKARLQKMGQLISDFDLLIGCTAIANDLILVTGNEQHFQRLNGITIENWIK